MIKTKKLLVFTTLLILSFLSISLISSADYNGSLKVNTGSGSIIIPPCQEDWSGSTWSQCREDNTQVFMCFDKNNCPSPKSNTPAQCGETRSCTETITQPISSTGGSSSGGGGGGGSSSGGSGVFPVSSANSENSASCIEKWECGEWSNAGNQCGTRDCNDINNCGTTSLKPDTSISCSEGFFSRIVAFLTGGVIGASSEESNNLWIGPILIIIIALGAGILIIRNRKK